MSPEIMEFLGKNGISAQRAKKIMNVLHPLIVKKGDVFCEKGKYADTLGILISGLLIAKYENDNSEKEIVSRFYYVPKNIIVSSFESFVSGTKTNETIEALEDSYLFTISKDDLYRLYDEIPDMNKIGRQLAEQSYIPALQRIHQLQTMDSGELLKQFYKDHADIVRNLQVNHICSYIGVNRNVLSRLQKKLKK